MLGALNPVACPTNRPRGAAHMRAATAGVGCTANEPAGRARKARAAGCPPSHLGPTKWAARGGMMPMAFARAAPAHLSARKLIPSVWSRVYTRLRARQPRAAGRLTSFPCWSSRKSVGAGGKRGRQGCVECCISYTYVCMWRCAREPCAAQAMGGRPV